MITRRGFIGGALTALASVCLKLRPERREQFDDINALDIAGTYSDDDSFRILALGNVGGHPEIAYSDDWGVTFHLCNGPPVGAEATCIAACEKEMWYIGFSDGQLWKTEDAGRSWVEMKYDLNLPPVNYYPADIGFG